MSLCARCGSADKIEVHHKKMRIEGGTDDPENLIEFCRGCHDYEHARRAIQDRLNSSRYVKGESPERMWVWKHRLEVLEALNTPELVRQRGYTKYWTDVTTHYLPAKVKREIADARQLGMDRSTP